MNIGEYTFGEFKRRAAEFHGYPAPGLLIGGYMVAMAKREMPEGTLFDVIVETGKCLPDAVQMLTLCSIGNNWMKINNLGRYALCMYDKFTGEGVRVWLDAAKLGPYREIHDWFLKRKAKRDQDSDRLFREIEEAGDTICSLEKIRIPGRFLGHKHMSGIDLCPSCGEAYPTVDGGICRGCQGEAQHVSLERRIAETSDPEMIAVPVEEAVGRTALHDMTRIAPGESKGAEFKAGQRITAGDVCRLQQMGRSNLYVEELADPGAEWVHEDEVAEAFARRMAGPGVEYDLPAHEGKINFRASCDGLLTVDRERLEAFNLVPDVMCATRQGDTVVQRGKNLAGTRAIPLYLSLRNLSKALAVLGEEPLFSVLPLRKARVGVLVTGTEVFQGLIEDKFIPVVTSKVHALGSEVVATDVAPDDRAAIADRVRGLLDKGVDLIVTTAGLSVDPDDVTRPALVDAGLEDFLYGAPVLPGAMTLVGRIRDVQVLGVPACALFYKTTSLDLLLPRLLAGRTVSRRDLARLAEGGFCLGCRTCTFPKCPFGR
ncbi:FmdE family protein [Salidesulfovibrio onnuriiensis]|uniref:FmdE family protein n=1 Tax=Salidesulfovibrio onnuriiensis TaxID=2583823 RepID=UPI0011C932AD|nr:FmdE family protein [Salidesulfovibrio onnuriiensis]